MTLFLDVLHENGSAVTVICAFPVNVQVPNEDVPLLWRVLFLVCVVTGRIRPHTALFWWRMI